jgi:pentatricopeptide repeat protein
LGPAPNNIKKWIFATRALPDVGDGPAAPRAHQLCRLRPLACGGDRWMTEQGVEPDTITYSALISACEKSGQWQKAVEIFGWMSMRRIEPNVYTYSALISACEKGGQWELAIEVFDEMRQAAVPPNVTTYNALISACEKGGQWRMALEVAGPNPQLRALHALHLALGKGLLTDDDDG